MAPAILSCGDLILPQIQGGPQIVFSENLRAALNLREPKKCIERE
jgi:hypothetical protein